MAGVVEGRLDQGDAGVFGSDLGSRFGVSGAIPEPKSSGVVVGFFRRRGFLKCGSDEFIETSFIDFTAGAIEDPSFVGEISEVIIDVCCLFHRQLKKTFFILLINNEGEVAVAEELVGNLLNSTFF